MYEEQAEFTSTQKCLEAERPDSSTPTNVSLKSDRSKNPPLSFNEGGLGWLEAERPDSPTPSNVSLKSNRSKNPPISFNEGGLGWLEAERPDSPTPSNVSLKSNRSKNPPISFNEGGLGWLEAERPDSPTPSNVSLKSNRSKNPPISFNEGGLGAKPTVSSRDVRKKLTAALKKRILSQHEKELRKPEPDTELYEIREGNKQDTKQTYKKLFKSKKKVRTVLTKGVAGIGKTFQAKRFMVDWAKGKSNKKIDFIVSLNFSELNSKRDHEESMKDLLCHSLNDNEHKGVCKYNDCKIAFVLDGLEKCVLPLDFENNKELTDLEEPASMDVLLTNLVKGNLLPSALLWIISQPSGVDKIPRQYIEKVTECREKKEKVATGPKKGIVSQPGEEQGKHETDTELCEIGEENKQDTEQTLHKRPVSPASSSVPQDDPLNFTAELSPNPAVSSGDVRKELTAALKKRILSQHEEELRKHETDTELYEIGEGNEQDTKQTYDKLFKSKKKVLMKGVAGIGKTLQAKRFMVDWAKGKSNRKIDFIVSLNFSEVNSKRNEVQSMKDLLRHSLSGNEYKGVCNYDDCKIVFVLDGLEKCELPLDFENNKDLTDLEEPASMDVLLTNLIKGNLLPSALLWIISQPSGVDKIPRQYIEKVTECGEKKEKLTAALKKRILSQHEEELRKHETDTEIYEIGEGNEQDTKQTYDKLFLKSKKKVRTVLMKGVAGIGKTLQAKRFMVDWAKGKSNRKIDFIVSLNFSELNSKRNEVQSMKDLLRHSLKDNELKGVCNYDDCEVAFVLDGLEKCEPPLDFEKNKDLTDLEEPASMDVLLTNLIKGNLLPSALLWIISQPSGVDKIPHQYIEKVTECGEKKEKLTAALKKRILSQHEEELRKHETDTEIYEIGEGNKQDKKQTYDKLFLKSKKKVRTVLTKGVAGIGKTFQAKRFMVDWAKGKSNKKIDFIVSLNFSEVNSKRNEVQSMKDLLRHSLKDNEHKGVCNYDDCEVAFVLDGLEKCELPLDFEKNKDLTDLEEPASMDVLLTNLIKGNLLPSALLWIISQPSGVDKIPRQYIEKVTECGEKKEKLTAALKKRILSQHEEELRKHETDTEIYEIGKGNEQDTKQTYDKLFLKSVKIVLMKGVAGIGKTFQAKRFMVDWANAKSNRKIDFIVSLNFSEVNSKRNEVQSMKDLLRHSLNGNEYKGVCNYDDCEIVFVLDGLEKCELPLDFENNKDLTDLEEPASMDVLLTNLIKGNLLPSALLWIISQPPGVDKIPCQYIEKVTECRETSQRRQKLVSTLRNTFLRENTQDEDKNHPNQENTEHIMREDSSTEDNDEEKNGRTVAKSLTRVNAISEIFKEPKGKKIRTVLTIGDAGIGKSFHVQKFIKEWAENKDDRSFLTWAWESMFGKAKDEEVIFPLNVSKLNLIKQSGGKISLVGLLNHFFKETKKFVISDFEKFKVLFVLDGLDAYQPPLDFENKDTLTDIREPASVDVLLTNLIRGNLLPSARLWITSRLKLPDTFVDRTTEIRCKPDIASKQKLKTQLQKLFTLVSEGVDMQKTSALLNDIYTDLYIIEGERGEVNVQHETRQVQDAKFKPVTEETSIKYHDIFKPTSGENKTIRTVLTIGVAGIGKSFATMKYMLDWAEGTDNKDIFYMFPLSFRELNLRKDENNSLEELIHSFFPGMKASEIKDYDKYKILIVLDGFDECRLDLDFSESNKCTDVKEKNAVNVLLTNLIQGNLLSKAQIWITSRPAASNRIPADKVDRVTEVRGFNDEQKEEYFTKKFSDKDLAEKILSHVKKSRSLYIMCHIPVFCWITSKVLEDFVERNQEGRMPKTLTDMYIYFLLLQCRQANVKYGENETGDSSETDSCWNTRNKETVMSLGKLAFESLEEGNLLFTEDDLTGCGVDITNTPNFSGLLTQIKREGHGLYNQKLFCFVHLSIQEFLAAFYVFHAFNKKGENLLTKPASTVADLPASDFFKTAVDKALDSKTGDWDLFLRFLLGLSLEMNQELLRDVLTKKENNKETNKATIEYIKEKIREDNSDADKKINLFYCLNELNDHSLVEEVKKYLHSDTVTFENFSASQWSALTFVLLTSDEKLDVFDLKKYLKSENVLLGMLPVVKVSKTALLSWCELSEESCKGLSTVLSSASSNLTELDLSHNDLKDSGVKELADGLKSVHCKLEILKLSGCQVTEEGCSYLDSALRSKKMSSLKYLDLSYNHPGDKGVAMLSAIAEDPDMSLKTLRLDHGGEHRLKPGLKKYGADLKLDENTASRRLVLSDGNRKVKTIEKVEESVRLKRPENEERFKRSQVFCEEGQKGLCYWEVEWKGTVGIAVAYKGVGRKWDSKGGLGCNENSWSLICSKKKYTVMHDKMSERIEWEVHPCQKIAVFLDWEGGTLTYYSVTSGELSVIHTFHATFTEPLFPGFWFQKGCVTLCELD